MTTDGCVSEMMSKELGILWGGFQLYFYPVTVRQIYKFSEIKSAERGREACIVARGQRDQCAVSTVSTICATSSAVCAICANLCDLRGLREFARINPRSARSTRICAISSAVCAICALRQCDVAME